MLPSVSSAVSGLACSPDGQWLASGAGSGDIHVWSTSSWAEAVKLRSSYEERPRGLVMSPVLNWLVSVQASALSVYSSLPPFAVEEVLPARTNPETAEVSEWQCAAFSPVAIHAENRTSCLLVAASTTHLCSLDYAAGWSLDMKRDSQTLLRFTRPMSVTYTACGKWIACGFENGQVCVWDALTLTLVKKLSSAHVGVVSCIVSSPVAADYEPRVVSCGSDWSICVWHSSGWGLEQRLSLFDRESEAPSPTFAEGVSEAVCSGVAASCSFSPNGDWFISTAGDAWIWRVCCKDGAVNLQVHQRVVAVGCSEALGMATFCIKSNAVVVGSGDGILNLWRKHHGPPKRSSIPKQPSSTTSRRQAHQLTSSSCQKSASMSALECEGEHRATRRLSASLEPEHLKYRSEVELTAPSMRRLSTRSESMPALARDSAPSNWTHSTLVRAADGPALTRRFSLGRSSLKLPQQTALPSLPTIFRNAGQAKLMHERLGASQLNVTTRERPWGRSNSLTFDERDEPWSTDPSCLLPEVRGRWSARKYEMANVLR